MESHSGPSESATEQDLSGERFALSVLFDHFMAVARNFARRKAIKSRGRNWKRIKVTPRMRRKAKFNYYHKLQLQAIVIPMRRIGTVANQWAEGVNHYVQLHVCKHSSNDNSALLSGDHVASARTDQTVSNPQTREELLQSVVDRLTGARLEQIQTNGPRGSQHDQCSHP